MILFEVKATLRGMRPAVWRRIQVPAALRLDRFHRVLQGAFGWEDCHLHKFSIAGSESRACVADLLPRLGATAQYLYDFGDDWTHTLKLLRASEDDGVAAGVPRCLAGKGACPPEDCGGVYGYARLLALLADLQDPEHAEIEEMYEGFDPGQFDAVAVNRTLAAVHRR